jgi:class 3 adenylate cyclase
MSRPPIKYVENAAGLNVAYWTHGEGPPEILWVPNFTGNCDVLWMHEPMARYLRKLSSIGRLTSFDSSGTGGSDPIEPDKLPTMEQWMDDVRAVMDAEKIDRATMFAFDSGGPVVMTFAATHPDRVAGLILVNSFARLQRADDYPQGYPPELNAQAVDFWLSIWGTGSQLAITAPSLAGDESWQEWFAMLERMSGPPLMRRPVFEMISSIDVRDVLPALHVPTLVLHRAGDRWIRVAHGRYLAENIPDAKYMEMEGEDHYPFIGDTESILREVRAFVAGAREEWVEDRVLATVLFTDMVDSTKHAARLGDRQWRVLLDRHDEAFRDVLAQFRGREVKTTGDGFLATFDGPARAVRCARKVRDAALSLGIEVRAGLHCGEMEVRGDDVGGLAVHVGARVAAMADAGEVLVSQTVKDLTIGSGLTFVDRGLTTLKGIPGEWRIYAVADSTQ